MASGSGSCKPRTRRAAWWASSCPETFVAAAASIWAGRKLALRPASNWRERYALADGERELVLIDGKSWGRRPVQVTLADPDAIEPGLLLFASFVVRQLAVNAANNSSGGTTAVMSGSYSG